MSKRTIYIALLFLLIALCACSNSNEHVIADMSDPIELGIPNGTKYEKESWTKGCRIRIGCLVDSCELKGRGHSTFRMPKHTFNVKLYKKNNIVEGLPSHKHWVLLANFFDHSLMRNALAFEVARQTSLADITPKYSFVRVMLGNKDEGVYQVCERLKDIVKDSLLKIDAYHNKELLAKGRPAIAIPSLPIDTLSFIDYWLIQELCMNAEPNGPRSCYMHISSDGILHAGPVWDFDLAFNPVGVDDGGDLRPTRFKEESKRPEWLRGKTIRWLDTGSIYNETSLNYGTLLRDSSFRMQLASRWKMLKPRFKRLVHFIDRCNKQIYDSAVLDQKRWNGQEPARFDSCTSYHSAYMTLRKRYKQRIKSLDAIIHDMVR